jgi:hypothetical protein
MYETRNSGSLHSDINTFDHVLIIVTHDSLEQTQLCNGCLLKLCFYLACLEHDSYITTSYK